MKQVQDYVIYGVTYDKQAVVKYKTCKSPTQTKEYKMLQERFEVLGSDLETFGYMTKRELEKQGGWLTTEIVIKLI